MVVLLEREVGVSERTQWPLVFAIHRSAMPSLGSGFER
jgi:hypothetical protein